MTSSAVLAPDPPREPFPLRVADPASFRQVERALRSAGFDENTICRVLGISSMADFGTVGRDDLDLKTNASKTFALVTRLFLFVEAVPREEVLQAIDGATLDAFLALDLLRRRVATTGTEEYYSPVLLYPVAGLLVASDRHETVDGSPFVPEPDAVFPAIFAGTLRFLRLLPRSAAWDVLDLCAGTGIGAMVLSQQARRAVAADITPRAAHFARFNSRLNGCHNVEVAQGDLYEAVAGRTFDRIVAHPPYVPAAIDTQIFRDGGETGETVLRRVIAGLPEFLRRGGTFYALCAGWDAKDGPFEERVRHWLGAAHEQFDVLFALHHEMSPADVARGLSARASSDEPSQVSHWQHRFEAAGVERRVYGALVVDRRTVGADAARGHAITRRLRLSPLTEGPAFEWLLSWLRWRETQEAQGAFARLLLGVSPRLSPHAQVNVAYVPQAHGLAAADVVLETDRPFAALTRIDPWMFHLVTRFDGERTAEQVYVDARDAGELADGFAVNDFTALVALLIERGYVDVDNRLLRAD